MPFKLSAVLFIAAAVFKDRANLVTENVALRLWVLNIGPRRIQLALPFRHSNRQQPMVGRIQKKKRRTMERRKKESLAQKAA